MKNKRIFIVIIVVLSIICIALGVLCIKFYIDIGKYKDDADYTYDLYLEGISDEEKNMYQEWIDSLGTDEYSAYNRGYKDGISEGEENVADENYSEAYNEGYNDAEEEEHSEFLNRLAFIALIAVIAFLLSTNHKLNKALKIKQD